MRCSRVGVFLFFASGALREVTLSRAPLRRPVCPILEGSNSSHRPDVSTRLSTLGIPSLALPARLTCSLIMSSALWPRIFLQDLLAHLAWCGVKHQTSEQSSMLLDRQKISSHSQAASDGIEIAVLATGFRHPVCYWSSSVLLVHSLRQGPPFDGCIR